MLAIAKPLIGWDKDIERYSKLSSGYIEITEQMKRVIARIRRERGITSETRRRIESIQAVIDRLATLDDPHPRRRRLLKMQDEVIVEFPPTAFWWPKTEVAASANDDGATRTIDDSNVTKQ